MKKLAILITILFYALVFFAQSDIIYPTINKKDIRRCKIIDVKNINIVYYQKGTKTDSIEAIAILKDDVFISLSRINQILFYKNQDYNYYFKQYNRGIIDRKIGMGITGFGIGLFAVGIITFNYENQTNGYDGNPITMLIGIGAVVNTAIGVGLWSRGSKKAKKSKKAMYMTNPNVNISLGTTKNGVGVVLNF